MRRLSLLSAAALLSLVGFAGAARAASFAWPSANAGASIRQADDPTPGDADGDDVPDADDSCPTVPGSEQAHGCPDADNDGVADSDDACPTQAGSPTDGCPSLRVLFNGYLQQGADIYATCVGSCTVRGTATLKLTRAAQRRLGVTSAVIGRFPFVHPCGEGVICAQEDLSSTVKKKAKVLEGDHREPVYLPATLTIEMTSPRKETVSGNVRLGLHTNGGRFVLYGAGYPHDGRHG